jgi:hypothetical protein
MTTIEILGLIVAGILLIVLLYQIIVELPKSSAELKQGWQALPEADKKTLINVILPMQRIVTCPNCVVVYEPAGLKGLNHETVEPAIRAILQANPNADLTKCETALGIKIINVQSGRGDNSDRIYL